VEQACVGVPGFRDSYQQFHQKAVIEQNSFPRWRGFVIRDDNQSINTYPDFVTLAAINVIQHEFHIKGQHNICNFQTFFLLFLFYATYYLKK
jgi:hypothetical protein